MDNGNVVHLHNGVLHNRKNNDILKFVGKWMDLENSILSEVTTKTNIIYVLTHKWLLDIKQRKTNLQFTIPENLDNNEEPKRDIHGSNVHGK